MKKKIKQGLVNPVAKAMLQNRKSPQVVAPKRGKGAKYNRGVSKQNAIRNEEFWEDREGVQCWTVKT